MMSIKVPLDVRDVMVEAAKLARDNPAFLQSLQELVDAHNRPAAIHALLTQMMQRLDAFERQLETLNEEMLEVSAGEFVGPDPDWFTGAGTGKRLTTAGEAEFRRLLDRGLSDKQIGKRMGMSHSTISQRRKQSDFEASMRSGSD